MRIRSRAGFTLIELMVAMALTLFIMVIMSQAFVTSLETFTALKGLGDMSRNLRTAEVLLRDDLGQDHFEGKRRLSDLNNSITGNTNQIVAQPPQAGFFAVRRSTAASAATGAPYFYEGKDGFGVPSYRATDHMIYMTVKRKGNRQENFFTTALPAANPSELDTFFSQPTAYNLSATNLADSTLTTPYTVGSGVTPGFYSSQWTEVLYFLKQTGNTSVANDPNSSIAGSTPIFSLFRAQWAMLPDPTSVNNASGLTINTFAGLSCNVIGGKVQFFSPSDAAKGQRVIPNFDPAGFNPVGFSRLETLVCPNVISFQVQVMPLNSSVFDDATPPAAPLLYDTTIFGPASLGLKAIQVTLRVWDPTTQQTRQITIVQDL